MFDFAATVCPHSPGLNTLSWTSSAHTFDQTSRHISPPRPIPAIWSETSATNANSPASASVKACMTAASSTTGTNRMGHVDHELVRGGPQHVGIVVVGVQGVGLGGQAHPHRGFSLFDQGRVCHIQPQRQHAALRQLPHVNRGGLWRLAGACVQRQRAQRAVVKLNHAGALLLHRQRQCR